MTLPRDLTPHEIAAAAPSLTACLSYAEQHQLSLLAIAEIAAAWYEAHPRRRFIHSGPRIPKAPYKPSPRSISVRLRARVLERDQFRCRRCGVGPDVAVLVVDHIIPVSRGGHGRIDNLQTLCDDCNSGKSDRPPHPHDARPFHEEP